MIQHT
ncbi:hypothetical protein YPPY36_1130, partial [Yersinia pestis PY-36]